MGQDIECLYCDYTIEVDDIFLPGKEFVCPKCGKVNVLDWDYIGLGNPVAWFVKQGKD